MGAGGKSARRLRHSAAAPGASRQCASLWGAARASRTRHTPHAASATRAQLDSEKIKSGEFSAHSSCKQGRWRQAWHLGPVTPETLRRCECGRLRSRARRACHAPTHCDTLVAAPLRVRRGAITDLLHCAKFRFHRRSHFVVARVLQQPRISAVRDAE